MKPLISLGSLSAVALTLLLTASPAPVGAQPYASLAEVPPAPDPHASYPFKVAITCASGLSPQTYQLPSVRQSCTTIGNRSGFRFRAQLQASPAYHAWCEDWYGTHVPSTVVTSSAATAICQRANDGPSLKRTRRAATYHWIVQYWDHPLYAWWERTLDIGSAEGVGSSPVRVVGAAGTRLDILRLPRPRAEPRGDDGDV